MDEGHEAREVAELDQDLRAAKLIQRSLTLQFPDSGALTTWSQNQGEGTSQRVKNKTAPGDTAHCLPQGHMLQRDTQHPHRRRWDPDPALLTGPTSSQPPQTLAFPNQEAPLHSLGSKTKTVAIFERVFL